jgi:hypothetical protein
MPLACDRDHSARLNVGVGWGDHLMPLEGDTPQGGSQTFR